MNRFTLTTPPPYQQQPQYIQNFKQPPLSSPSVTHQLGCHRQKLDQIRDSLKPFEQQQIGSSTDCDLEDFAEQYEAAYIDDLSKEEFFWYNQQLPAINEGRFSQVQKILNYTNEFVGLNAVPEKATELLTLKKRLAPSLSTPTNFDCNALSPKVNGMGFDSAAESSGYGSSIIVGRGEDEGINLTGFDQCLILPSTSTTTFSSCVNKQYSLQQHNQQQQRLQQHISITQSLPPPLLNVHQQSPSTPSTASSSSSTSPSLSKEPTNDFVKTSTVIIGQNPSHYSINAAAASIPYPTLYQHEHPQLARILPENRAKFSNYCSNQGNDANTSLLRHSNSFNSSTDADDAGANKALNGTPNSRTVIKIGRNASDRIIRGRGEFLHSSIHPQQNFQQQKSDENRFESISSRNSVVKQTLFSVSTYSPNSPRNNLTESKKIYVAAELSPNQRICKLEPTNQLEPPPCYENIANRYNNAPAAGTNIPMPSFNPNIRISNNANYPSIPSTPITAEAKYAVEPLSKNNQEQFRPNGAPISGAQNARCCISPLPESIAQRLQSSKVNDRHVKPCRPAMFRFYMEQHVEKLIQQHRERNQRLMQLIQEMEQANLNETWKGQMLRLLQQKESKYLRLRRQKINKNLFQMIRHIGVGAFGKVTLVRKHDTGQVYAMKTLKKADVIEKQQVAHVKAERDILSEANSVWIVKLFYSFQDSQSLYFIMEYVPGGDMMQLLINKGIFSERLARFYIAELSNAIEYVHSLGFIHRDIKPDNILIDKEGHIKLTDFGLCTGLRWTHDKRHYVIYDNDNEEASSHVRDDSFNLPPHMNLDGVEKQRIKLLEMRKCRKRNQAHSVVGTKAYMAPEVIQKVGYRYGCDWWSVGVILYEMVYGRPPFLSQNDDPAETQFMIVHWRYYLDLNNQMSFCLSHECIDFISMLCQDQETRLGCKNGARDIKNHPWFKGIDFDNIRNTKAEYIPKVEHPEDTSNFEAFEVPSEELFRTLERNISNPDFYDFTFRNFFANDSAGGSGKLPFGTRSQQRPSLRALGATDKDQWKPTNQIQPTQKPSQQINTQKGTDQRHEFPTNRSEKSTSPTSARLQQSLKSIVILEEHEDAAKEDEFSNPHIYMSSKKVPAPLAPSKSPDKECQKPANHRNSLFSDNSPLPSHNQASQSHSQLKINGRSIAGTIDRREAATTNKFIIERS